MRSIKLVSALSFLALTALGCGETPAEVPANTPVVEAPAPALTGEHSVQHPGVDERDGLPRLPVEHCARRAGRQSEAVQEHLVVEADLRGGIRTRLATDRDPAGAQQSLDLAPRAKASGGEEAVEPDGAGHRRLRGLFGRQLG